MTVYTVGHSSRTLEELVGILRGLGVQALVDIRRFPRSRTNPQFLVELARRSRCAIMCSEALWWRCHRRIVADYLLSAGVRVLHVMGRGELKEGALTPFAHAVGDGTLLYTQAQT